MDLQEQIENAEHLLEELKRKQELNEIEDFNKSVEEQVLQIKNLVGRSIEDISVKTSQYYISDNIEIEDVIFTIDGVKYRFTGDPFYVQTNY